jgi:hypothetical protein
MVSRTVDGICLGPTGNIQGAYKFLSLLTNRVIQARSFTCLPMPNEVIGIVNQMGAKAHKHWGMEIDDPTESEKESKYKDKEPKVKDETDTEHEDKINENRITDLNQENDSQEIQGTDAVNGGETETVVMDDPLPDQTQSSNSKNSKEHQASQTHTVTRHGREVRYGNHLYDNYDFHQEITKENDQTILVKKYGPSGYTPSVQQTFGISKEINALCSQHPA